MYIIIGVAHQVKWAFNDSDPNHFTVEYPGGDRTLNLMTKNGECQITLAVYSR